MSHLKFLFLSFTGRIGRLHWWIAMLTVELLSMMLAIAGFWLIGEDPSYYWNDAPGTSKIAIVEAVVLIITLRFALAVDIKRLHDRARTAYVLIPLYLLVVISIYQNDKGQDIFSLLSFFDQRNGESDIVTGLLVLLVIAIALLLVYALWLLIELGFLRGTKGNNKYGPDPLAPLVTNSEADQKK